MNAQIIIQVDDVTWIKVHGFKDGTAGTGNIDKNSAWYEARGVNVLCDERVDYGRFGLLKVRFARHEAVQRLVVAIEEALAKGHTVVCEGYSNGWNFLIRALQIVCRTVRLKPGQKILLIGVHPAGENDVEIPACVERTLICITRSDFAVRAATYIKWLVKGWGRLGFTGYRGPTESVETRDYSDTAQGHGGLYHDYIKDWFASKLFAWAFPERHPT